MRVDRERKPVFYNPYTLLKTRYRYLQAKEGLDTTGKEARLPNIE